MIPSNAVIVPPTFSSSSAVVATITILLVQLLLLLLVVVEELVEDVCVEDELSCLHVCGYINVVSKRSSDICWISAYRRVGVQHEGVHRWVIHICVSVAG